MAFSEPESAGARDEIKKYLARMGAFFSLHTYGNLWLVPYSFSLNEVPEDLDEIQVGIEQRSVPVFNDHAHAVVAEVDVAEAS